MPIAKTGYYSFEYSDVKLKKGGKGCKFILYKNEEIINDVMLPIVSEKEKNIPEIDENFYIPSRDFFSLAVAMKEKDPVMIYGPTQCGKTSMSHMLAALTKWPIIETDCNGQTTVEDLLGTWMVGGNVMTFKDGPATEAYRNGYILILNEFDMLKPEIAAVLNDSILSKLRMFSTSHTNNKGEVITETVEENKNFRIIATCNSRGYGDDESIYEGIEYMNAATLERFPVKIKMDYPDPETEIAILRESIDEDEYEEFGFGHSIPEKIVDFTLKARHLFNRRESKTIVSTYRIIKWIKYIKTLGPELAFEMCILNHGHKTDSETLIGIYNRIFGITEEKIKDQSLEEIRKMHPCIGRYDFQDNLCINCDVIDKCRSEKEKNKND